jgi:ribosomal protein L14
MIFKESILLNSDRSGSRLLKVFHCYNNFFKQYACLGHYIKASVKDLERWPRRIRGKRYRPIRVGFIQRCFLVFLKKNKVNCNVFSIKTQQNKSIVLRRRGYLKSPYILSPIIRPIRTKRFYYIFDTIL